MYWGVIARAVMRRLFSGALRAECDILRGQLTALASKFEEVESSMQGKVDGVVGQLQKDFDTQRQAMIEAVEAVHAEKDALEDALEREQAMVSALAGGR